MTPDKPEINTRENSRDHVLSDPVLPPLEQPEEGNPSLPAAGGVSPALKRGIILFSVFTVLVFGIFGTLLIKKLLPPSKETAPRDRELLVVAEQLQSVGLYEQAIGQYEKFLNSTEHNRKTRAEVAYKAGQLYLRLDNCREGLVYLFQSQTLFPDAPWAQDLNTKTDACISRLKTIPTQ